MKNDFIDGAFRLKGEVDLVLVNQYGHEIHRDHVDNVITTSGSGHITSRMTGVAQAVMGWMELGTGATAAAIGDTLLQTFIAGSRTATTPSVITQTTTNDTVQHVCTFGAGIGTGAVTEAGIFNVATANTATMLNRVVFSVINKGAADSLTVTWKIRVVPA